MAIDVARLLKSVPPFTKFCSVDELARLTASLAPGRFDVAELGKSADGRAIHHIRCGSGRTKAMFVGFPHANEPIGGLTIFSLLILLGEQHPVLMSADVEWHIVPCIDPDATVLNEGWTQNRFTFASHMRHFHRQELGDQAECSFPIRYGHYRFDRPTPEALLLKGLIDRVRPDFYYSLHNNGGAGGAWFALTFDLGAACYEGLYALIAKHGIALQVEETFAGMLQTFSTGIFEMFSKQKAYDHFARTSPNPEQFLSGGSAGFNYVSDIKQGALAFVSELPYLRHPSAGSKAPTPYSLRQLKLRADADNKELTLHILDAWDRLQDSLDPTSPFYRKIFNGLVAHRDKLLQGMPSWPAKTVDILQNPAFNKTATEAERFGVYMMDRYFLLCQNYAFVRLLKASAPRPAIDEAIAHLDALFDAALADIDAHIGLDRFTLLRHREMAVVQLGAGLHVLDALIHRRPIHG